MTMTRTVALTQVNEVDQRRNLLAGLHECVADRGTVVVEDRAGSNEHSTMATPWLVHRACGPQGCSECSQSKLKGRRLKRCCDRTPAPPARTESNACRVVHEPLIVAVTHSVNQSVFPLSLSRTAASVAPENGRCRAPAILDKRADANAPACRRTPPGQTRLHHRLCRCDVTIYVASHRSSAEAVARSRKTSARENHPAHGNA
jgi:hypothetical protein